MSEPVLLPRRRLVEEWRPIFIATLRASGNVRLACKAAGISRETAMRHRGFSKDFADEWDIAIEDAIDLLEAEAWKRAKGGSDSMIQFLLKALRRDKFGDKSLVEHKISAEAKKQIVRLAREEGLDEEEVLAEVERHLKGQRR